MSDVILFVFAGRRENLELQLPLVQRILDLNPTVEYHVWNTARRAEDSEYLKTITGDRITIRTDFQDMPPGEAWNAIYREYATEKYADTLFVKIDDDVVFLETERFADFLNAIDRNRGHVVSANVINNGACTWLTPKIWRGFEALGVPLLDVHMHSSYAELSHRYAIDNWTNLVGRPVELITTEDWLSINMIGYDWQMGRRIANLLGTRTPRWIAGRDCRRWPIIGDEGAVNTLPRLIALGVLACHLTFGPQHTPEDLLDEFRTGYADMGRHYLKAAGA